MKRIITLLMTLILVFTLTACSVSATGGAIDSTTAATASQSSAMTSAVVSSTALQESDTPTTDVRSSRAASIEAQLAENSATHDVEQDYVWDSAAEVLIALNGNSITADGDGVLVNDAVATITAPGTYRLSGALTDGQIIVDTANEGIVRLILDGVELYSSTSAPIYVANADETLVVLADNSENTITDGSAYVFTAADQDEPNAAIFSTSDLTIYGNGALTVVGNFNDGIASKDGLIIASGTITVNAVDDGIRGKDYLVIKDGNVTVTAQGDGLKSNNDEDPTKGYISIETGLINITSTGDAITAQTDALIADGTFTLSAGGGSDGQIDETTSAKGIKGGVSVMINGGTFAIDSADDALHSNGNLVVNAGDFNITSGDDGMHADATLEINGGDIKITQSYEGIESAVIAINAGNIHVVASDDGINVAGGADSSGMVPGTQPGAVQDTFASSGNYYLYINGGYIAVDATGDGIDVNGAIEMTDGVVLVNGPTENMNAALDYDAGFNITGGFFVAAGSAGMAQAPDQSSSQYSVLINFTSALQAGTLVHIQNSAGEEILTFAPTRQYQSIAFSSPELANGGSYTVYISGESSGATTDGLYTSGTYSPGTEYTSFTISSIVTVVGTTGFGGRPGHQP